MRSTSGEISISESSNSNLLRRGRLRSRRQKRIEAVPRRQRLVKALDLPHITESFRIPPPRDFGSVQLDIAPLLLILTRFAHRLLRVQHRAAPGVIAAEHVAQT